MSNQTSITVIICYKIKKIKVLSKIKIIKLCRYFKQILIKNTLLSNIVFCFAPYFRRANKVRRYIRIHDFHHIKTYMFKQNHSSSGRPMNAPTVWFVQTIKMLRSGIFSFLLYKLSSRIDCRGTRLLTFGGNWIII